MRRPPQAGDSTARDSASAPTATLPEVNEEERRAANEEAVRGFFARWDPAWRWILILGLRQLRAEAPQLGALASIEANGKEGWADEAYVYGPLSHGLTAAAVNEVAQYCEDLFALLRSLREPQFFARDMTTYRAGQVVDFGRKLANADDDESAGCSSSRTGPASASGWPQPRIPRKRSELLRPLDAGLVASFVRLRSFTCNLSIFTSSTSMA